jgi:L-ascorbate 6-phosphate lactonase
MTDTAVRISETRVAAGSLAVFWLGQAGFVFKTPEGRLLCVDPYLSDSVERLAGFRRIMASVMAPEDLRADVMLITHHHEDHLDIDALPIIARRTTARFIAPEESAKRLRDLGVQQERIMEVRPGSDIDVGCARVRAVFADHGMLAPDAVGFVLDFGFVRVYITGDTAYRPESMTEAIRLQPEIIIPVINGAYGNLGSQEAAALTRDTGARVVIPCHFWTFIEHGGDPAAFLAACKAIAPAARVELITQGSGYTYAS